MSGIEFKIVPTFHDTRYRARRTVQFLLENCKEDFVSEGMTSIGVTLRNYSFLNPTLSGSDGSLVFIFF